MHDAIHHPKHYTQGKFEAIDVIEDWKLNFHRGNACKYIARAGKKDPEKEIEDLEKARWYLQREIDYLKSMKQYKEKTSVIAELGLAKKCEYCGKYVKKSSINKIMMTSGIYQSLCYPCYLDTV